MLGKAKLYLFKILKVIGWFLAGLLLLLVIMVYALRFPAVQDYITTKAVRFYEQKTNHKASIGRLYVDFPSNITVEDLYLEDINGDTLINSSYLTVRTDLWALLDNQLQLSQVEINGLQGNVIRDSSQFNFQFIIDAFSSTEPSTNEKTDFDFSIGDVLIENTDVKYNDDQTGIRLKGQIGKLETLFDQFDLNESKLHVARLNLENTKANLQLRDTKTSSLAEVDTSSIDTTAGFFIGGDKLLLSDVKFTFEDQSTNLKLSNDVGTLEVDLDKIDILHNKYTAHRIVLKNAFISFDQFTTQPDTTSSAATSEVISLLAGSANTIIENSAFRYYDHNQTAIKGFDPAHLWVQKINGQFKGTYIKDGDLRGDVRGLSLREMSGLNLKKLTGQWHYTDREARVEGLQLQLNQSVLNGSVRLKYSSLATLAEHPETAWFDIDLQNSLISVPDVKALIPEIRPQLQFLPNATAVKFSVASKGYLDDFSLDEFKASALASTQVDVSGKIKGLPDIQKANFNLNISDLRTSYADIKKIQIDSLIPDNINLPDSIQAQASFKGRLSAFESKAKIKTSMGNIDLAGSMKQRKDSVYRYKGQVALEALELNRLLANNDLGKLTLNTQVDGQGFSIADLNTLVKGSVDAFDYRQYHYRDLAINGTFKNQQFDGYLAMHDENLDFDFNGLVNYNDTIPEYKFKLDLHRADFAALHLTRDSIKARGIVNASLKTKTLKSINGYVNITQVTIAKNGSIYPLDSMALKATSSKGITDMQFNSSILEAELRGNFEWVTLPGVIQNHLNRYFVKDTTNLDQLEHQDFTFNANFKNADFFREVLVPGLENFVPGKISGKYNSSDWLIDIDINMVKIAYKGTSVDSLDVRITSDKEAFNFDTRLAQLTAGGYDFKHMQLLGNAESDHVKADFKILDDKGEDRYHFGGELSLDSAYIYKFLPGEFLVNYDKWQVREDNQIKILDSHFWVDNLVLSREDQSIRLQSKKTTEGDSILDAQFTNFDLSFIGKFRETRNYLLGGILNGGLSAYLNKGTLKADVGIRDFSFKGDTLGNIEVKATNQQNVTSVNLAVSSKWNDLKAKGEIRQEGATHLNLVVDFTRLDLATVQAFTADQLSNLEGKLSGSFKITGTLDDPDINGNLALNDVAFKVNYLGSTYHIPQETIALNKNGLSFDDFVLLDEQEDKLQLEGAVNSKDYRDYDFDLILTAHDFQLLNTEEKDNQLVFGHLSINSDAALTGSLANPKIKVDLRAGEESEVTYVIPESQISVQQRKGVVEFFDADIENDPFFSANTNPEDTIQNWISGIDLQANIAVDKTNTFNVIIDPVTRDQLSVSGDANLTLTMRPTGDMTLTGRYDVNDGAYDLNFYGIVKRKFDISPGSYLIWTGDPLNAKMDVSASYFVRATPLDLDVKQKIPFNVILNLKGELLSPQISFQLDPQESNVPLSVQTWLSSVNQQESALNRQVFSLLLFKSFMSSGGLGSGGDNNIAESTARNSVSRILSNQLNRLGSKVQGLELSFDLQSYQDYNEGNAVGRTELELGLSKQFFDERVVVKVAGNFDLEGESQKQKSFSDFAGDLKIEYKLTEDGRFRLQGFRQNEYDNLLQGEIAKTGVGVIFVRDYNVLKELFAKPEKKEMEEDNDE